MDASALFLPHKSVAALLAAAALLSIQGCSSVKPYSAAEARAQPFAYAPVYDTIIDPLSSVIAPIYKRIFFLKNEVSELKDRLWDGGSDQRVMRIDENIDMLKKEIWALSDIKKEILNALYYIYPPFEDPEVVPYLGKKTARKKNKRPVIMVSLEDQREYQDARMCEDIMSEQLNCRPLIAAAIKKFESLPDSLKKPVEPIGTAGPVPRIRPYTPPPLYRGE
ncbi:MAG: hypothetical protein JW699_00530 [Chitinispirillaceae bacterium]|nr:hypothetical protein [Chitinispirillaceae bacterium]